MAKLPTVRRLAVEDFQDQKSWIQKLLSPLNDFLLNVVNALSNNLTFAENVSAQVTTIKVETAAAVTAGAGTLPNYTALRQTVNVKVTTKFKPVGLWVINCQEDSANPTVIPYGVTAYWTYENNQIKVSSVSGLSPSKSYFLTFIAITG